MKTPNEITVEKIAQLEKLATDTITRMKQQNDELKAELNVLRSVAGAALINLRYLKNNCSRLDGWDWRDTTRVCQNLSEVLDKK